jgi:hypothetical protein
LLPLSIEREVTTTTTIPVVALPPPHLITDGVVVVAFLKKKKATTIGVGAPRRLLQPGKANNPMYGRTGDNHPMYGKVPANAMSINVYSLDNELVQTFSSMTAAAKFLILRKYKYTDMFAMAKFFNPNI